jgi:hypothetical protein
MRQYSLIRFNGAKEYPFQKKSVYVYFGEIPNMLGHCIVMDKETNQFYVGYHIENFEEIPEDET